MNFKQDINSIISETLQTHLVPVVGCTEVAAICLATSIAYNAIIGRLPSYLNSSMRRKPPFIRIFPHDIQEITIKLDGGTFKNASVVRVPGTSGLYGIEVAAAVGVFCDPNRGLNIFDGFLSEGVSVDDLLELKKKVKVEVMDAHDEKTGIYVESRVKARSNRLLHEGVSIIRHAHSEIVYVGKDGEILFEKKFPSPTDDNLRLDEGIRRLSEVRISELVEAIKRLSDDDKRLITKAIKMNLQASEDGLKEGVGLNVGDKLRHLVHRGLLEEDMVNYAKIKAAAAVDMRMSGHMLPVMSCAGSGNLGLTASLPVIAVAEKVGWDEKKVIEAVALSFLIVCYVTYYSGYLTPLCGCAIKAGAGVAAATSYYLGGNIDQIGSAIKNVVGNITGMICDGAKVGCAMKVMSATGCAIECALLALEGVEIPFDNGVVEKTPEATLKNVGKLCESMGETNRTIIHIIREKYPSID